LKSPHLLRVEEPPDRFAPLIEAARAEGLRIGWLELAASEKVPDVLESAASLGVLRAVTAGGGRTVSVKPLRGEPVLKDLLREHFLGCALVLVRGEVAAPRLSPDGDRWRVETPGEAARAYGTAELVGALRRPSPPWPPSPGPPKHTLPGRGGSNPK
jgi:hypothetical protein